jgi:4'-phosphopantetheinyl transferase
MKRNLPEQLEVDLWWVDLRREPGTPADQCLAPEELARGARFVNATLRRRFLHGRTLLRLLLASYLDQAPAALRFRTGRFGKPALAGRLKWSFNASHSGDWYVCAIARHRRLGVDVEMPKDLPDARAIAARFFSAREREALRALSAANAHSAFFSCWTRKEALVKATGLGLTLPLDGFDVAVGPQAGNCLLAMRLPCLQNRDWHILDATRPVEPPCAVAADGPIARINHREWTP